MKAHDKWMEMATMYMSCGKQDSMVLMMMQKIHDDDNQAASNSNSPPRTIAIAALCPALNNEKGIDESPPEPPAKA
jgi:hypothetical protein